MAFQVGFPRARAPISNGEVGFWKCDETSGTNVKDYSANGNDGTSNVDVSNYDAAGMFGGSGLRFNSSSYNVDCGSDASLYVLPPFTMTYWVKMHYAIGAQSVCHKRSGAVGFKVDWWSGGSWGNYRAYCGGSSLYGEYEDASYDWRFLGLVVNGASSRLHVDDIETVGALNSPGDHSAVPLTLGGYSWAILNDLRIFNRALTASEVKVQAMRGRS